MARPWLLWENVFEDGTLASSPAATGWPVENVIDWRGLVATAFRWKKANTASSGYIEVDLGAGNSASPDTLVVGGHNFATAQAEVRVRSSDDGVSYNNETSFDLPTTDKAYFQTFTPSGPHRFWRIQMFNAGGTFAAEPQVGILTLGRRLESPVGYHPSWGPYNETAIREGAPNRAGEILGVGLRAVERVFRFEYPSPGLRKTDFFAPSSGVSWDAGFIPHSRSRPFWFAWNTDEDPVPWLCWRDPDVAYSFVTNAARRTVSVVFRSIVET